MKYLLLAATDRSNIPLAVYDTEQDALAALESWGAENVIRAAERQGFPDCDPAKVDSISLLEITVYNTFQFCRIVRDFGVVIVQYRGREIRITPDGRVKIIDTSTGDECDTELDSNDCTPEFFTALRTAIDRHLERLK